MAKKLSTLEMEIALMSFLKIRQNLIVPNVHWGLQLHECDILLLTKTGYAMEVEIKVSKHDLKNDKKKWHRKVMHEKNHMHRKIARFFYAVPEELKEEALKEIPDAAGLYTVKRGPFGRYIVREVKKCKRNSYAKKWSEKDRYNLARLGALRILNLKKKVHKLSN